ncbi:MAG: hypothetical protein IJ740_08525 [Ruminococcus sp.]|nr:hypothetical protein [Ruminococcus sp.]
MNVGILASFGIIAIYFFLMGFCVGVMVEDKQLRKWFDKELRLIEERYKRKKDGDSE